MRILDASRYALTSCLAVALLAGCGGSQAPIGTPGAIQQSSATHRGSSSGDLLYASTPYDWIYVFAYPSGSPVTSFNSPAASVDGLCADAAGDVFVVGYSGNGYVFKYAHGATSPSSTITIYSYRPYSCAVDPTTGNLAVFNYAGEGGNVAIYQHAEGDPNYYSIPNGAASFPGYCAYDDKGDLFVDVTDEHDHLDIAELPIGGSTLSALTLAGKVRLGTLRWISPYLTVANSNKVLRLSISGSTATVVGRTRVVGGRPRAWIEDAELLEPYGKHNAAIGVWKYPKGGKPVATIHKVDKNFHDINSIVVSAGQ